MIGSMFLSPYSYSLGARCGAEVIGTMLALFLGDAAVANELLAKTKGNGYGWGFLAIGFGLAFGFPTMMFGHISAFLNPAACLFQWVAGNLSVTEFLALSFSELAGAFLGAILLWLIYLPHFNVVPEPPSVTEADPFLADPLLGGGANRTFSPSDLAVGGYNNDPKDQHRRVRPGEAIQGTMREIGTVLGLVHSNIKAQRAELLKARAGCISLRCATVANKEEIQRRLDLLEERSRTLSEHEQRTRQVEDTLESVMGREGEAPRHDDGQGLACTAGEEDEECVGCLELPRPPAQLRYEALLIADQNTKLGIFATRPAIYAPHWNFLCEFMGTITLLVMANMIAARGNQLYEPSRGLFDAQFGFTLAFFIFLIVLVLGGPTGVAINPARDLGPRIAHWMLPIPGKGPSEFLTYGWIPVVASLAGGAAAGGLFLALQKFTTMTDVPAGSVVCPNT